ncbi:hypothetical protein C8R44DRAFT_747766 [Mycena epipterygia]|nr:hypothetical protein C8R44DRAFT_747766 [Mycena epipterygia]
MEKSRKFGIEQQMARSRNIFGCGDIKDICVSDGNLHCHYAATSLFRTSKTAGTAPRKTQGLRGDKCCGGAISLEEHGLSQSKHKRVQIRGENLGGVAGGKRELSIDAPNIRLQSASLKSTTRTYDAPKLDVSWTARLLVGSTGEGRKKTLSKSIARSSGEHVE